MKKSVFGILRTREEAERVVDRLKQEGFTSGDVSVLFPDTSGTRDFAHEHATKAPEGAATGGATGFVIGGVLGWLAGFGSLAIPGLGPFIAAGPIMAALSGAGVGAAVGGITGALIGMGIPEYEARRYEAKVKEGNILVSVHADDSDQVDRAKRILTDAQAEDVATSGEAAVPGGRREETPAARREEPLERQTPYGATETPGTTSIPRTSTERSDFSPAEGSAETTRRNVEPGPHDHIP